MIALVLWFSSLLLTVLLRHPVSRDLSTESEPTDSPEVSVGGAARGCANGKVRQMVPQYIPRCGMAGSQLGSHSSTQTGFHRLTPSDADLSAT